MSDKGMGGGLLLDMRASCMLKWKDWFVQSYVLYVDEVYLPLPGSHHRGDLVWISNIKKGGIACR